MLLIKELKLIGLSSSFPEIDSKTTCQINFHLIFFQLYLICTYQQFILVLAVLSYSISFGLRILEQGCIIKLCYESAYIAY